MPRYNFKCPKCSLRFERTLKIAESHSLSCPDCKTTVNKMPPTGVGMKMAEPTSIPKDIDLAVGKDAERKWAEYHEKEAKKEKIRKETGSERLSIDFDGNYQPFSMKVDGKEVSGKEGTDKRFEMLKDYMKIKNDPDTKATVPSKEDLSKAD